MGAVDHHGWIADFDGGPPIPRRRLYAADFAAFVEDFVGTITAGFRHAAKKARVGDRSASAEDVSGRNVGTA